MPNTLPTVLAGALAALCLAPAAAGAAPRHLWATVNVCDTKKFPDRMGVRARMPGNGERGQRMRMRFTAQFRKEGRWARVDGGRSDWIGAGPARVRFQERGFTFPIDTNGNSFLLRGVVEFQWVRRKNDRVAVKRRRVTAAGHATRGADPNGFSASKCRIEP